MSEWIHGKERLPTIDDANDINCVLLCPGKLQYWYAIDASDHWMPIPKPPDHTPSRRELVKELLDAVDAFDKMDGTCEWTDVMKARKALR